MPKPDIGRAGKNLDKAPEPVPSTEVQTILVGTLIGAILLLIVFSIAHHHLRVPPQRLHQTPRGCPHAETSAQMAY